MNKIIIAIDPGFQGSCAVYFSDTGKVETHRWEGFSEAVDLLADLKGLTYDGEYALVAYIENVPPTVGRGKTESTGFKLGQNFGFWLGILYTLYIKIVLISPATWQKCYPHSTGTKNYAKRKREFKEHARRIFAVRCAEKDADAMLLLDYAMGKENCK